MFRGQRRCLAVLVPIALGGLVAAGIGVAGKNTVAGNPPVTPPALVKHDVSPPLKTIAPKPRHGHKDHMEHKIPVPPGSAAPDPVLQRTKGTRAAPALAESFEGVAVQDSAPPDPNGAVGPAHYVQVVNESFEVFSKSGSPLYGPVPTNTLWTGFGTGCESNDDGDATVSYDRAANRWVLQQFSVSTDPYLECIAVSASGDPTGAWYRYAFSGFGVDFPDYPKLGVWPDAYYVTYNLFADAQFFDGPEVCAYNRAKMLAGESAETGAGMVQCRVIDDPNAGGLLPADLDGSTPPPAGSPNYVMGFDTGKLQLWRYHVDWASPAQTSLTGPVDIPVAAFDPACDGGTCIPQPKFNQQLDSLGDRLMYRLAYRNFGDHESMVVTHSVKAGSSVGVRWYEIRDPNGTPTVYQQGTYAPDAAYRWMGSAAMNGAGAIALGYSLSSPSRKPSIAYTGRLAGDPLGTMTQSEGIMQAGGGSQGCCLERWGDYSSMSVDPVDDCTFWYTNEYLPNDGTFNWHTRIAAFRLGGCQPASQDDFTIAAQPTQATVTQGQSGDVAVQTAVSTGSAQQVQLSASGLPYGATATFSPATIQSGESSTLTIDAGPATPVGTYMVNVVGSGATATQSVHVQLTVSVANAVVNGGFDAGLAGWTAGGGVPPVVVTTKKAQSQGHKPGPAAELGSAQAVAGDSVLSQTVAVPAGPSRLSFWYQPRCKGKAPANQVRIELRSTGGATLATVYAGCKKSSKWIAGAFDTSPYAGQDVVLWFDAIGSGLTKTTTLLLLDDVELAAPAGTNVLLNSSFESGDLGSWTPGGVQAPAIQPGGHGGAGYAARLGSDAPFDGNSSLAQTLVVPGGSPVLTLWYQPHCPDTLTFDQIQVQVRSTTGALRSSLLQVCSKSGKWTRATVPLASFAGQQIVLYLNVHDDGHEGDPTWALFDDLSLS
jgi:hypothetical protein